MSRPLCRFVVEPAHRACGHPPVYVDADGGHWCGAHRAGKAIVGRLAPARGDLWREWAARGAAVVDSETDSTQGVTDMAVLTGTLKSATVNLPFGAYGCRITLVEDTFSTIAGKENEPQVKIRYQTLDYTDADGEPVEFSKWYSVYNPVKPSHLLGQVFSAALYKGEPFPEGAELDTADLQQARLDIIWGPFKKRDGTMGAGVTGHAKFTKRPLRSAADTADDDEDDDEMAGT